MYRIVIKRCEKDNPLCVGKHYKEPLAQYRVVDCYRELSFLAKQKVIRGPKWCAIILQNPRQINTFINPSKSMFPPNKKGVKA